MSNDLFFGRVRRELTTGENWEQLRRKKYYIQWVTKLPTRSKQTLQYARGIE